MELPPEWMEHTDALMMTCMARSGTRYALSVTNF